ncbi:OLC1v1016057C1 [Oldenlandia corymbosa var. corymbosa]|uniref:OLC1v1016057C1 n=1 Tax=Oldenlandia corymbosa var. corymbosa TaxID=529605 RepID=A0AAV1E544_OLDCO|nr:OLC1v1016057C1 [Oldenlandia corymbosa var. corymbosa]
MGRWNQRSNQRISLLCCCWKINKPSPPNKKLAMLFLNKRINEVNVQQINDAQQVSAAQEGAEDLLGVHQGVETSTQLNTVTETFGASAAAAQLVSIVADNPMIGIEKFISIWSSLMAATSSKLKRRRESPMTAGKLPNITPLEQNPVDVQSTPKMCGISSQTYSISNLQGRLGLNPKLTPSFPSSSVEQSPVKKLNPEASEFTISPQPLLQVLLPITAAKSYLSKDDTEIGKNTETFIPNYSIEKINSEGGLNHASEDDDFDMEYAKKQESFYSEISAPTYHNRSKKAKAKKTVQVRRSARLNKDSTLL